MLTPEKVRCGYERSSHKQLLYRKCLDLHLLMVGTGSNSRKDSLIIYVFVESVFVAIWKSKYQKRLRWMLKPKNTQIEEVVLCTHHCPKTLLGQNFKTSFFCILCLGHVFAICTSVNCMIQRRFVTKKHLVSGLL